LPTPAQRVALYIGATATALVLVCAGTGVANADPDESGSSTDTGQSSESETPSTPQPTTSTTPEVKAPLEQLRDALGRPRAIFGNGRLAGQPPSPMKVQAQQTIQVAEESVPDVAAATGTGVPGGRTRTTPSAVADGPADAVPAPAIVDQASPAAASRVGNVAEVRLPFAEPFTIPLPTLLNTTPTRFVFDLTDPRNAIVSFQTNVATFNTILNQVVANARATNDPTPPPPPQPALRTMEESPVLDVPGIVGDTGPALPGAGGSVVGGGGDVMPNGPVVRVPLVIPLPRVGPPRPIARTAPVEPAPAQVIGTGSAGVRTSDVRGSIEPTGTVATSAAPPANTTSAMGNTAFRQGYPQSLRAARVAELAVIAVPGLAGLLVLTAGGGMIGYRQANAARFVRADAARFLR
jgi:hypothetical protein